MIKVKDIEKIKILTFGFIYIIGILYNNGTTENFSFNALENDGIEKLTGLEEFIQVNKLEEKLVFLKRGNI